MLFTHNFVDREQEARQAADHQFAQILHRKQQLAAQIESADDELAKLSLKIASTLCEPGPDNRQKTNELIAQKLYLETVREHGPQAIRNLEGRERAHRLRLQMEREGEHG